ncbi:hypothetical protein BGZ49_003559 [Haplosporangium sp. Z 27]|nr:hypothetical protein BGZ49_003559 [Haplosporangium sp. Z 27]
MDRYRYRNVDFINLTPENTENILENACLIQKLSVDLIGAEYFFQETYPRETTVVALPRSSHGLSTSSSKTTTIVMTKSTTPTNLKVLCCRDYGFYGDFGTYDDTISPNKDPLSLIDMNPNLSCLELDFRPYNDYYMEYKTFTDRALESISQHLNLTRIQWISDYILPEQIMQFLEYCPRSLQDLEIDNCTAPEEEEEEEQETKPVRAMKIPSLQRLVLRGSLVGYESEILIPILKNSPNLEELSLPQIDPNLVQRVVKILNNQCQKVYTIDLGFYHYQGEEFPCLWSVAAVHLLMPDILIPEFDTTPESLIGDDDGTMKGLSYPDQLALRQSNIRELSTCLSDDHSNFLYQYIIGTDSTATAEPSKLEVIHLRRALYYTTALPAQILGHCPHLRDLSITCCYVDCHTSHRGVDLAALADQQWTCTKLESLKLDIKFHNPLDSENLNVGDSLRVFSYSLRRLHQKLRSLKYLKKLEINWKGLELFKSTSMEELLSIINYLRLDNNDDNDANFNVIHQSREQVTESGLKWMGLGCFLKTLELDEARRQKSMYLIALRHHQAIRRYDDVEYNIDHEYCENVSKYFSWEGLMDPWYRCDDDDDYWLDESWCSSSRKASLRNNIIHQTSPVQRNSS